MMGRLFVLGMLLLSLIACGGGGGSGGGDDNPSSGGSSSSDGNGGSSGSDDDGSDDTDDDSSDDAADDADLTGTWLQTNVNSVTETGAVFKTRRQTIIVEQVGEAFSFTDCISGSTLTATLDGDIVRFTSGGVPDLTRVDDDTLQLQLVSGPYTTEVGLVRVSDDVAMEMANVSFTNPDVISEWDQVCVETIVDTQTVDEVKLKAVNDAERVVVGVNLQFSGELSAGQYEYPSEHGASGYVTTLGITANLYSPEGTIVVSENATTDFALALTFRNSVNASVLVPVEGVISIAPSWFTY